MTSAENVPIGVAAEFTKAQLTKSGSPVPHVDLSGGPEGNPAAGGLAFDSEGNLWAANYSGAVPVLEWPKGELTEAHPTPQVVISGDELNGASDLVFSSAGDLWVLNGGNDTLLEFTKAQLARSGSPTASRTIGGPATKMAWPCLAIEPQSR